MQNGFIKTKRLTMIIALLFGLMCLQGCATVSQPTDFIGQDTKLEPDPEDSSLLWWETAGFSWHRYTKVMIDPITILIDAKTVRTTFDPAELAAFSRDVRAAVTEILEPDYAVVTTPGSDVLRLRAAITDIDPSNPAVNLLTALILFVPLDMGGAAIEVEFLDSITGKRLAAMVDRKTGTPLQLISGLHRLGHARAAFDKWGEGLKFALKNNP